MEDKEAGDSVGSLLGVGLRVLFIFLLAPLVLGLPLPLESTGCEGSIGSFVRSYSGLIHYPFIIPATLAILGDLFDPAIRKIDKARRFFVYSFLIYLLWSKFLVVFLDVVGC